MAPKSKAKAAKGAAKAKAAAKPKESPVPRADREEISAADAPAPEEGEEVTVQNPEPIKEEEHGSLNDLQAKVGNNGTEGEGTAGNGDPMGHGPKVTSETMGEDEKKKKRAERFGVQPIAPPEADKKKLRAERFKDVPSAEDKDKLAKRAERFKDSLGSFGGSADAGATKEDGAKKKARLERFCASLVSDVEEARRKARAEKFK